MGFRNPITSAGSVDTRFTPAGAGVQVLQDNSDPAHPRGIVQFTDGFAADVAAQLLQHAEANTHAANASQGGGVKIVGGSYGGPAGVVAAPNLDLRYYQDGSGNPIRSADLTSALSLPVGGATGEVPTFGPGVVPAGVVPFLQAGSQVLTLNASGQGTITYPTPFPTAALIVVACPGDVAGNLNAVQLLGFTATSFNVRGTNPPGNLVASTVVRIDWLALGW